MRQYDVYVPVEEDSLRRTIDARSGIVGEPEEDVIHICYEGNRYGAENMVTFADRCYFAASRLSQSYPTVAQAWVEPERLIRVGTFTPGHGVDPGNATELVALAKWLGMWNERGYLPELRAQLRFEGVRAW